jgi:hypothetical protein
LSKARSDFDKFVSNRLYRVVFENYKIFMYMTDFWDGLPSDLPDLIYDGTNYNSTTKTAKKIKFWGQTGVGSWQTTHD